MRRKLQAVEGQRLTFIGAFERLGVKAGYNSQDLTVLLKDVRRASGEMMTDHQWFNYTKGFQVLRLEKGDLVQFDARSMPYRRGKNDYQLDRPTKIKKLPFNRWSDLVADPALEAALELERRAVHVFNAVELAVLSGAGVDADAFLLTFRNQHALSLEGISKAWTNHYDYMVRNAGNLADILAAYRDRDYSRYVELHDPHSRLDALLALRHLGGFRGREYWQVLRRLQDGKCDLQRTDAWRRLQRPFDAADNSN